MSMGITRWQAECLAVIRDSIRERGVSPTYTEIRAAMGLVSNSTVARHIHALIERGYLGRHTQQSRGLFLVKQQEKPPVTACDALIMLGGISRIDRSAA
jgi:repressor LexA